MDPVVESVIISYTKLIVTVLLIVLIGTLAYKSLKYIRALYKRGNLMRRLRKVCRENGYRLKVNACPLLSVFFPTKTPEITVDTRWKTYHIKFIAFVNPARTYLLNGEHRIYINTNHSMILLNIGGVSKLPAGLPRSVLQKIGHKGLVGIEMGGNFKELTRPDHHVNFPAASATSENILCIHPTSQEMLRVEGNGMVLIFDGDRIGSSTVYSGSGLLNHLAAAGTKSRSVS
ncbi:MAG: hypothetical protein IJX93_03005 [Clostridia bacterium]|nr:hypothetical protein [Clostridia bacterium]MBQ8332725.1 hypothetical protein [Clostridia bacterium]MBQ8370661.1 hypothetical protein [Clostridia bacterium]